MNNRPGIGYVVEINGPSVVLNMLESHRGHVVAHQVGFSSVGYPGELVAVDCGDLIVLRVEAVMFSEPREAHKTGVGAGVLETEPLRQIRAVTLGTLRREEGNLKFLPSDWVHPPLGSQAFPLTRDEILLVSSGHERSRDDLILGTDVRDTTIPLHVDVDTLLGRHLAVLGGTGQGKTHFVASILQQLTKYPNVRVVIFDVNGEYSDAFNHLPRGEIKRTCIGSPPGDTATDVEYYRIPYQALGRPGLFRLLLPSERTQAPALRFAIEHLPFVAATAEGAGLVGQPLCLVDDGRRENAKEAYDAMLKIRGGHAELGTTWPHMRAISSLVAEWYALTLDRNNAPTRDAFHYGHISSLVNRVRALLEDDRFAAVVDVGGGQEPSGTSGTLNMQAESEQLVRRIFGSVSVNGPEDWKVHLVDLSQLTQDLMPFVLGSLLELYASELFRMGPKQAYPTLLVLEEAHHYLRQLPGSTDAEYHTLAYERLAKEGRKFHLSLIVSTQRPAELSSTVLSQCGTWCVLRITNDTDLRAISAAGGVNMSKLVNQIPVLSRGQGVVFGAAIPVPWRIALSRPDPEPRSADAPFARTWTGVPDVKPKEPVN